MTRRFFTLAITLTVITPLPAAAQATRAVPSAQSGPAAKNYTPPRTPWREPDLQGTYSNRTITPFERPANVGGREFFTPEEVGAVSRWLSAQTLPTGTKPAASSPAQQQALPMRCASDLQ